MGKPACGRYDAAKGKLPPVETSPMDELRQTLLARGASLVGFADLRPLPADVRGDLPFGVSIAVALFADVVEKIGDGPTEQYLTEYRRVNELLDRLGRIATEYLRQRGYRAEPIAATITDHDAVKYFAPLPHKTVATRAGLGWVGRCALVVTEQFGSAVRFASVLTDAPLPTGTPIETSRCGDCTACVDKCPGHAPTGRDWQAQLPPAEMFDRYACYRSMHNVSAKAQIDGTICGMCIAACPWTQRYLQQACRRVSRAKQP
jgi:epoxyqueuosine reductase